MMCRLVGYVLPNADHVGLADAESRIAGLPGEVSSLLSHPVRGPCLNCLHGFRECHGGREREQNVNVIDHTIDNERLTAEASDDSAEIGE